jgi:hypothetical protein
MVKLMFRANLFVALSAGLIASACAQPNDRRASIPASMANAPTTSEQNCLDYGFAAGSVALDRCVKHLDEDARSACAAHGLFPGTPPYEHCVSREIDAHRYRKESRTPYEPVSSDEAFHYENGFGYDAEDDRIDSNGGIVNPNSTTP